MRKVLIICGGFQFGGVERFVANIIRYAPYDEFDFDFLVFEGLSYASMCLRTGRGAFDVFAFPSLRE